MHIRTHFVWRARNCLVILLAAGTWATPAKSATIDAAWLPITDAERTMKAPIVEKDAGAEAIFWRVHVRDDLADGDLQRVYYNYVRLKIFDEKGKEAAATIDLPFGNRTSIRAVAGRTIKADGTELELKKESIYERDLVRAGRIRLRVKSFALPGVEPGAIVEYRWQEVVPKPQSFYIRAQFQREFPVQKVTYFFSPVSDQYTKYRMAILPFHCTLPPPQREPDGFQSVTLENMQAFREEPMMPGEPNVRAWALVFYSLDGGFRETDRYWNDVGREDYNKYLKPAIKSNEEIKETAATAVSGAASDEEKVLALIRYIRKNLRDLFSPEVTAAERAKVLKDMSKDRYRRASEIIKSGVGDADELNTLFAAMASSVGLQVRPALVADREDILFVPSMTDRYFLRHIDMAVNLGGNWKLYDVSARDLPANMLSWTEEGMKALVSDPDKPFFVAAPVAPPEASARVRKAKFSLSDDGAIEGDIEQEYSGHSAKDRRHELEGDSDARRLELFKDQLAKIYPDAEISDPRIENASDPEKPLTLHFHLKAAGYAQRTGKRLLLPPFFFERGATPMFSASERKYPVHFAYAWNEHDSVTFELPPGFVLDNPDAPSSMDFGPPGAYKVHIFVRGARELISEREFTFGNEARLFYDVQAYPQLKRIFEEIQKRDDHTISLKQTVAAEGK
jgi:hypothetical protein